MGACSANALRIDADGVGGEVDEVELPCRTAFLPQVGDVGDGGDAVAVEEEVAVVMAVDERHDRVGAHGVGQLVPVVDVVRLDGHVGDEEDGVGTAALAVTAEDVGDVFDVLRCHVAHGHAHHRTRGDADEAYTFMFKREAFVAEDFEEVHAAAFTPVLVVIALDDVPRLVERAEQLVGQAQ